MVQTTDPLWRKPSSSLAEAAEPQTILGLSELRLIVLLLAPLVVLRIWVAGNMDFESDETYYWLWSRHMALSFYDHPPVVAYLIGLGTWLLGDTALGLRSMSIVAILIASGRTPTPPIQFTAPRNPATNAVRGRKYTSSGDPTCSRRPSFMTAT